MGNQELESLKLAIKTEEDGRSMYLKAAEQVTNPLAKATMNQLAKEELVHIEVIKRFYASVKGGGKVELNKAMKSAMNYELRMKTIFETARSLMDKTVKTDPNVQAVYNAALIFEEKGADMYKTLAGKTQDPTAKKIYQFLFEQESEHFRLLQEGLNYLEHPDQWFLESEKPHFEG